MLKNEPVITKRRRQPIPSEIDKKDAEIWADVQRVGNKSEVARMHNVSRDMVRDICAREGQPRVRMPHGNAHPDHLRGMELLETGMSLADVARAIGASPGTVWHWNDKRLRMRQDPGKLESIDEALRQQWEAYGKVCCTDVAGQNLCTRHLVRRRAKALGYIK